MGANSLKEAEAQGAEFARLKGASSIAALRALPAEEILDSDPETSQIRFGIRCSPFFKTIGFTSSA